MAGVEAEVVEETEEAEERGLPGVVGGRDSTDPFGLKRSVKSDR